MNIDTFIKKGDHPLCEDYILSGQIPIPYIILSDGCSSSQLSDIGSRILALSAKKILSQIYNFSNLSSETFGTMAISQAKDVCKTLHLPDEALDATLVIAFIKDKKCYISIYGDGIFFYKDKNGLRTHIIEYASNAPYYLNYNTNFSREQKYKKDFGSFEKYSIVIDKDIPNPKESYCLREGLYKSYDFIVYLDDIEFIGISSDGLSSFYSPIGNEIPLLHNVVEDFTLFKNTNGVFMQRRANKVIKNFAKESIYNFDDLSIGVMLFGEGE